MLLSFGERPDYVDRNRGGVWHALRVEQIVQASRRAEIPA